MEDFYDAIARLLTGESGQQHHMESTRLDLQGISAVLGLYEESRGREREALIRAMGSIVENANEHPGVAAQVLEIINALDLTQVDASVQRLVQSDAVTDPYLHRAIQNYNSDRELAEQLGPRSVSGDNGQDIRGPEGPGAGEIITTQVETESEGPIDERAPELGSGTPVDREREVELFRRHLSQAEAGQGTWFLVSGQTGVGKTSLLSQFFWAAHTRGFLVANAEAHAPYRESPYYLWSELIATLYGEAPLEVRQRVSDWRALTRLLPESAESGLHGPEGPPNEAQVATAVAWFLKVLAAARPLALFIDNLEFADRQSVDLLAHLARDAYSYRIVLVVACNTSERHDEYTARFKVLQSYESVKSLELRPFSASETSRLLAAQLRVSEVAPWFVRQVQAETRGVPLYINILVRALVDHEAIRLHSNHWVSRTSTPLKLLPTRQLALTPQQTDHVQES